MFVSCKNKNRWLDGIIVAKQNYLDLYCPLVAKFKTWGPDPNVFLFS